MPLVKGAKAKTKAGMKKNLKAELAAGKPKDQALAIMYSEAGEKKAKRKKK
jgi:hypothetical protein